MSGLTFEDSIIFIVLGWGLGHHNYKKKSTGDSNVQPELKNSKLYLYLSTININYPYGNTTGNKIEYYLQRYLSKTATEIRLNSLLEEKKSIFSCHDVHSLLE